MSAWPEYLQRVLMWCSIVNYVLLIVWFVLIVLPHGWMMRLFGKNLKVTAEEFDRMNMAGLVYFKAATILFFVVPFFVLYFVNRSIGAVDLLPR